MALSKLVMGSIDADRSGSSLPSQHYVMAAVPQRCVGRPVAPLDSA